MESNAKAKYEPSALMHDKYDAMIMSLSAIALMSSHPYLYWKSQLVLMRHPQIPDKDRRMYIESAEECEKCLHRVCEMLDEVMQYIGDYVNGCDSADEHGMTDAAFAAMNRALGRHSVTDRSTES